MPKKTKYARHLRAGLTYVRKSRRGTVEIRPYGNGYWLKYLPAPRLYRSYSVEDSFRARDLPRCLRLCAALLGKPAYSEHFVWIGDRLQPLDPATGDFLRDC